MTSWSNLASDMVVEDHKMVGQDYCSSAQCCGTVHGRRAVRSNARDNPAAHSGIDSRIPKHNGTVRLVACNDNVEEGNVIVQYNKVCEYLLCSPNKL